LHVQAETLIILGCKVNEINAGSISFNYKDSLTGALGEFVERYSAAMYNNNNFITDSYNELICKKCNVLDFHFLRFYSEKQYEKLCKENIFPLGANDVIEWIRAYDYLKGEYIFVPAFTVYMPYYSIINSPHNYIKGVTSTGLAAGNDLKSAVVSGFFECAERHAFATLWYKQNELTVPQYSAKLITRQYKNHKKIVDLYSNRKVRIKSVDLSSFSTIETIVTFLYFEYKGKIYQSLGAACRFDKIDALIKAAMEAYQGIEYAISLDEKGLLPDNVDLESIDDFDKHFHFYNKHPHFRNASPLLQQMLDFDKSDQMIYTERDFLMCKDFSKKELEKTHLPHLIYVDITPVDIKQINFSVARVITPTWSLLTGIHGYPFLGHELESQENLFTELPHPFP
jgi:ribosomal protein S12 methylthiotransferase accessory factor